MSAGSLFFKTKRPDDDNDFIRMRAPIAGFNQNDTDLFQLHVTNNHIYLECGDGRPFVFCAGLYGSIYNVTELGKALAKHYRFIVPYLPMYELPLSECTVPRLADYLKNFAEDLRLTEMVILGSSVGGGAALNFALQKPPCLKALVLCGSSGLSTIPMQKGFLSEKNYEFIKEATQEVFFDPSVPCEQMIQEVFDAIQDYEVVLRSVRFTRSTAKDQLHQKLADIKIPVLLIWGKQDRITPPETAALFNKLLPNSELHYIDRCGHVPTQEQPEEVMNLITAFLNKLGYV